MSERSLGALEAVLFIASTPLSERELADTLGSDTTEVAQMLDLLATEYETGRPRGFELRRAGGGWRLYTNPMYDEVVERFVVGEHSAKLSTPALETLAVIAYRQPVTRAKIAQIRGVNVDGVVRTLLTRGLVAEVGETPSGAHLYGTTAQFLEAMGMNSLAELAPLAPYLPDLEDIEEGDLR